MAEITLRVPLGRPLTYQEVDDNFSSVQDLTLLAQQFALTAQEASTLADVAKDEAVAAKDEAVRIVNEAAEHLGSIASVDPAPSKVPMAGTAGTVKQAWVHELEFALDKLRVATNKALYGDGPYPVLDFQFQGAKYLDPRINFTRASKDWDEYGNEYGINEPVLTDKGLWASGSRTNMQTRNASGQGWSATRATLTKDGDWHILTPASTAAYAWLGTQPLIGDTQYCASAKIRKGFSGDKSIRLHPNGFGEYKSTILNEDGSFTVSGVGVTGGVFDKGDHYLIFVSAKSVTTPVPSACFIWDDIGLSPVSFKDVQLETGSKPTPYIPTVGSQVTVANTDASLDVAGIFGDEGTVVFDVYMLGPRKETGFALTMVGEGGSQEYMGLGYGSVNPWGVYLVSGGANSNKFAHDGVRPKFNEPTVFAFTWSGRDFALFVNGSKYHFGTHGAPMPVYKKLYIGSRSGSYHCPINSRNLQLYKKRLTDEQLQELTTL